MIYQVPNEIFKHKDVINKIKLDLGLSNLMLVLLRGLFINREVKVQEIKEQDQVLTLILKYRINEFLIIKTQK